MKADHSERERPRITGRLKREDEKQRLVRLAQAVEDLRLERQVLAIVGHAMRRVMEMHPDEFERNECLFTVVEAGAMLAHVLAPGAGKKPSALVLQLINLQVQLMSAPAGAAAVSEALIRHFEDTPPGGTDA